MGSADRLTPHCGEIETRSTGELFILTLMTAERSPGKVLGKSEEWSCSNKKGSCICDLTLFPGQSSPTMSFPITPRNVESSPNCKDNTQWFSSSAAEVSAPRTAGTLKGWFNSIVS